MKKLPAEESTSLLLPSSLPLSALLQIDDKGWNGQKVPFTEATSNSEYRHVSLCLLPFPPPPPPLAFHHSLHPAGGFSHEMARHLISVTGQWASDCQLNWPCVLVGSLRIQAYSHRLTGPPHRRPLGTPPATFLSKKQRFSLRINTQLSEV